LQVYKENRLLHFVIISTGSLSTVHYTWHYYWKLLKFKNTLIRANVASVNRLRCDCRQLPSFHTFEAVQLGPSFLCDGRSIAHRFETAQWPLLLGPGVQYADEEEEDAITRHRNFVQLT